MTYVLRALFFAMKPRPTSPAKIEPTCTKPRTFEGNTTLLAPVQVIRRKLSRKARLRHRQEDKWRRQPPRYFPKRHPIRGGLNSWAEESMLNHRPNTCSRAAPISGRSV
jgi:hypothetical protein